MRILAKPYIPQSFAFMLGCGPVVVFAARLGEELFGCGGACALHYEAGDQVTLIVTSNEKLNFIGSNKNRDNQLADNLLLTDIARIIGYERISIWDDMKLENIYGERLISRITEFLCEFNPKLIYLPSVNDPDQGRANVGLAIVEAIRRSQILCFLAMYEVGTPLQPDHFQDITKQYQKKWSAIGCLGSCSGQDHLSEATLALNKLRAHSMTHGIDYAEAFKIIDSQDLDKPMRTYLKHEPVKDHFDQLPLFSIIIRSENRPELADALTSIATQIYPKIEVILVDVNGSGNIDTEQWCGQFPVTIASKGRHLNRGEAANLGLDSAQGYYIGFLDDDDWLLPSHVSSLINALSNTSQYRAAFSGVVCRQVKADGSWQTVKTYNEDYDPIRLLIENYIPIHAVVFEQKLLEAGLRFDESLNVYEDWDFWIQLSDLTDFLHLDHISAIYRITPEAGFGVREGNSEALLGLQSILTKWSQRWTPDQLSSIALYPNRQRQLALAEVGRLEVELEKSRAEAALGWAEAEKVLGDNKVLRLENEAARADAERAILSLATSKSDLRDYLQKIDRAVSELSNHLLISNNVTPERKDITNFFHDVKASIDSLQAKFTDWESSVPKRPEITSIKNEMHHVVALFKEKIPDKRDLEAFLEIMTKALPSLERIEKDKLVIDGLEKKIHSLRDEVEANSEYNKNLLMQIALRHEDIVKLENAIDKLISHVVSIQSSPIWRVCRLSNLLSMKNPKATRFLGSFVKIVWWSISLSLTAKIQQHRIIRNIFNANLFSEYWYYKAYPEVVLQSYSGIIHWLISGWQSGYNPHPLFDTRWYTQQTKDFDAFKLDPITHYLTVGYQLGLSPHPLFDSAWYSKQCSEISYSVINPLSHFLNGKSRNLKSPHPLFDCQWYLSNNPDVAQDGVNPLLHYVLRGAREGRNPHPLFLTSRYIALYPQVARSEPNPLVHYVKSGGMLGFSTHPLFDGKWYLENYPEVRENAKNPLIDFLTVGYLAGRNPNPYFDVSWYLQQYTDQDLRGKNPLLHYLEIGSKLGLNPSPIFDGYAYLKNNPDVAAAGINPLEHFILKGQQEGRLLYHIADYGTNITTLPEISVSNQKSPFSDSGSEFFPSSSAPLPLPCLPLRPLAFYLPQFHPIAENDAWWGKGFTEWTNVTRAQPQFVGHHQPRLPGDLGFYDLRLPEIQAEQIRLARQYGIYGFCYHYYWFGGKRLLDRPLRQVLADPSLDLPFCLCWANENWTRRWDGEDQEILIGQQHSPDDDLAFIRALVPVFRDPRYIQVDGKPLLLVYRPQILPDPAATVARWRQELADQGEPGLFLAAVQSFRDALARDDTLFDALVEFPPHGVPRVPVSGMQLLNPHFRGELLDYEACVAAAEAQVDLPGDKLVFPGIMTAWDNTARRQDQATIFAHASPAAYGRWLTACCRRALAQPAADRRLVFINAWNEWAEGSYLEPDRRYGYAYLQATRDALLDAAAGFPTTAANRPTGANPRLLFVGHDAHRHGAQLLTLHLVRLFARRFGYRVRLWLLGDGALRPDYEALAEVERLDPEPEHLVPAARRLRAEGIDQAIVNTVVSAAVLPALDQAGMKTLALIHELPQLIQERGLVDNARAVAAHATTVLFAADTVRQAFATLAPLVSARTRVLPQGIYQDLTAPADARAQVARALGLPADAILVINVGYGDTRKGFDLFLDTARLTVTADPRFHFLWLGQVESGWQPRLERERQRAPLIGHLHQLAFTPDVGRYYAAADIFLLSSREDPFPSVVLEALACGVPVVAAAGTGGHGELLADPLNGTLAGACGEVQALDLALRDLAAGEAQDPSRRARRAATARARFDFVAYGWELLRQLAPGLQCVSVVVPNYNYARYLRARLASILGQSYPVFEILVLDDASTDDSTQVVAACQRDWDRDITLIVNDRNSGSVFAQWRQGIDRARGDLLWIAEADDLAMPDFLASLAPRFAATPSLTMAFVDAAQIDSAGQRLGDSYAAYCGEYSALDFHRDFSVSGATFLTQGLGVRNTVLNVSGVLFRRAALVAALARVGTELERWTIAGDWRLYCELCRAGGEVHYVAQPLNQHRRHAASVVGTNALPQHLAEITAMHELLAQDLQQETLISQWQADYRQKIEQRINAA